MYPWISRTLDFGLQFVKKSAAYTWTFTVFLFPLWNEGAEISLPVGTFSSLPSLSS